MKKYTIIYSEFWNVGSHTNSITKFDYVETDNLMELLKREKYDCSVWFIFDGWCKQINL